MGENGSEKLSETKSDIEQKEEFFDCETKSEQKEVPIESKMA